MAVEDVDAAFKDGAENDKAPVITRFTQLRAALQNSRAKKRAQVH